MSPSALATGHACDTGALRVLLMNSLRIGLIGLRPAAAKPWNTLCRHNYFFTHYLVLRKLINEGTEYYILTLTLTLYFFWYNKRTKLFAGSDVRVSHSLTTTSLLPVTDRERQRIK
jgi:hypothetical protein